MSKQPFVFVVVLSFNGASDTCECLDSLLRQDYPNIHVLVIDNASTDGAPAAIHAKFPNVELLEFDENCGWAGGNNIGIRIALKRNADLILLLNNDTVLTAHAIATLADAAAVLGPCLLHPAIYYYDTPGSAQLDPKAGVSTSGTQRLTFPDDVFKLEVAIGACLLVHAEVFRTVGLLDERFFLQLEDNDLYYRAQSAGFESFCASRSRVLHKESRSFGGKRTAIKTYYSVRTSLLITEKHDKTLDGFLRALRTLYWSLHWVARSNGQASNSSVSFLRWLFSKDQFAIAARKGVRDYCLRQFGRLAEGCLSEKA